MGNKTRLDQEKWSLNIDFEQPIKIFLGSIRQSPILGQYSCIQNQDIDPPPLIYCLLNELFALVQVAHVGFDCNSAIGTDRLHDFLGSDGRGEVIDDDVSTSSTEGKGGCFPDPLGRASHDCDFARERSGRHCDRVKIEDEGSGIILLGLLSTLFIYHNIMTSTFNSTFNRTSEDHHAGSPYAAEMLV